MSERGIKYVITGDASGWSTAVTEAQRRNQEAQANAAKLGAELDALDARRSATAKKLQGDLLTYEREGAQARMAEIMKHGQALSTEYARAVKAAETSEKQLTTAVQRESATRIRQHEREAQEMSRIFQSGIGGALGIGVGAFAGVALAQQMAQGVRDAITGWVELGHEIEHIKNLMGTTAENASVMDYVFRQFGLTGADVSRTVAQLTRHIVDNEAQFNALGIATRESNGEFKNQFDIFQQLRGVMSDAADGTAKTALQLQLASRGGSAAGQSFNELNQILSLNDEQWNLLAQSAGAAGLVMSDQTAKAASQLYQEMKSLEQIQRGLSLGLGRELMPALQQMTEWAFYAIEVVKQYGKVLLDVGAIALHFFTFDWRGAIESGKQAINDFMAADTWDALVEKVQKQIEVAKKVGEVVEGSADPSAGLKSSMKDAAQAIRDEMKAVQEAGRDAQEALRAEYETFRRTHEDQITLLEKQKRAVVDTIDAQIARVRELQTASTRANDAAIAGLRDQLDARSKLRAAEIDALQDKLRAFEEQQTKDKDTENVAKAQAEVDKILTENMVRIRSESLDAYGTRVKDHNKRLADAQEKLEDEKKKLSADATRMQIQDQINVLQEAQKADTQQTDSKVKAIQERAKLEKQSFDDQIRYLEELKKKQTEAFDGQIAKERELLTAAQRRNQDAITAEQRHTEQLLAELQKRLDGHVSMANRIGALYPDIKRTITYNVVTVGSPPPGGVQSPDAQDRNRPGPAAAVDDITQAFRDLLGHDPSAQQVADFKYTGWGVGQIRADIAASPEGQARAQIPAGRGGGGGHLNFAAGGSMLLTQPTALVGLGSGRIEAIAGEAGAETATFTPGGRGGGGHDHGDIVLAINGREFLRATTDDQYRLYRLQGGSR